MDRVDKWKEAFYLPQIFIGEKDEEFDKFVKNRPVKKDKDETDSDRVSMSTFFKCSKEIIFDLQNDRMKMSFIVFTIDPISVQICITGLIETADPLTEEDVKYNLAMAQIYEVPVLPNNENSREKLLELYSQLYESGFEADDKGVKRRLKLTEKSGAPGFGFDDDRFLESIDLIRINPPALALAARRMAEKRDADFRRAKRFLDEIESAISSLRSVLSEDAHQESDLQNCLKANPILFGTEYREVIPKLALGAEFEMDFALKTWNGEIHILEIEDSHKFLFTKKLRPSAHLVHAEQQVLDWYDWIERFPSYAESQLVNLARPYGFIIIGRTNGTEKAALANRNRTFRGKFEILTYDDLLHKAENLKAKVSEA